MDADIQDVPPRSSGFLGCLRGCIPGGSRGGPESLDYTGPGCGTRQEGDELHLLREQRCIVGEQVAKVVLDDCLVQRGGAIGDNVGFVGLA